MDQRLKAIEKSLVRKCVQEVKVSDVCVTDQSKVSNGVCGEEKGSIVYDRRV
jgi:hypothetical protein